MISAPYCNGKSKLNDGEDDRDACVTTIIVVYKEWLRHSVTAITK